jgi:hypothetical protein
MTPLLEKFQDNKSFNLMVKYGLIAFIGSLLIAGLFYLIPTVTGLLFFELAIKLIALSTFMTFIGAVNVFIFDHGQFNKASDVRVKTIITNIAKLKNLERELNLRLSNERVNIYEDSNRINFNNSPM